MTSKDALGLLRQLASPRLEQHAALVGEAGELLLNELARLGVAIDAEMVRAGIVLHDIGKSVHREELDVPGSRHEEEGERLLLARGVPERIARICRSHTQWETMTCSLEELVVALADKLWKGARVRVLEERVVDAVSHTLGRSRWDLFVQLDDVFEQIAAKGSERLERSGP
jgi:putative nucleotidyltransferase with HDIG domain